MNSAKLSTAINSTTQSTVSAPREGCKLSVLSDAEKLLADEVFQFSNSHGFAVQVALDMPATALFQKVTLLNGFDTFGDHLQLELVSQENDGFDDRCIGIINADLGDEAPINFQSREWVTFEQAQ